MMTTSNPDPMAAQILDVSASAFAAYASDRLFEKRPETKSEFGEASFQHWKNHFVERIKELSVAIAEQQPALFLSRVRWTRGAFQAREVPVDLIRESLVCLAEILDEELPPACRKVPSSVISAALQTFEEPESEPELPANDVPETLVKAYLLKALEGNAQEAIDLIVEAFDNGLAFEQTYNVLMTAQREIGVMWHQAEVNIAEEHVVTATTERALAVLSYRASHAAPNGRTVVSVAVAGNVHDIGVRIVSDFFTHAGWKSICLGSDLPANEIAESAKFFQANLVLLSAAMSTQIKAVREAIEAVRHAIPSCKVMVGGTAFTDAPDLSEQLGADAYTATPSEAVEMGGRLVSG